MSDITELNVLTGQETTRSYTEEESTMYASFKIDGQDQIDAINQEIEDKKILLENAILALKNLGLTEAQAKAIAGV